MSPAATKRRNASASSARLLAAATSEFAEYGYDGARIDRISASSGFNRALLFQRFGDKSGLYRAVLSLVGQEAVSARSAVVADHPAPSNRAEFVQTLRKLVRATTGFLNAHPEAARILSWERASGWIAFNAAQPQAVDPAAETITEWFRIASAEEWLAAGATPERQLALVLELVAAVLTEDPQFIEDLVTAALVRGESTR